MVSLFLLVSGVDAALDHLARADSQNSYTLYNGDGNTVLAYSGDLDLCPSYAKLGPVTPHRFLHRIKASS